VLVKPCLSSRACINSSLCATNGCTHFTHPPLTDYIYTPAFDSGGLLWPLLFDRLMTGVFLAQFIVVAVLSVKEGTVAVRVWSICPVEAS
jgi:hypothetical protein